MSTPDPQSAQAKLLEDIERFARSEIDLKSADTAARTRESSGLPSIDPNALPAGGRSSPAPTHRVATPTPAGNTAPATPSGGSLLEKLKREAVAKQMSESQHFSLAAERARYIDAAMRDAFQYLNELSQQLNVLKPAMALVYNVANLVDLDGMAWQEGRADFRLKPAESDDRLVEQVVLRYRMGADRSITIERENPTHVTFRDALAERQIAFKEEEVRNARSQLVGARFTFPCEVKAGLAFGADYGSGEIRLQVRNIQRFGAFEYRLAPEALTHDALEELAHFILGEQKRIEKLFRRVA